MDSYAPARLEFFEMSDELELGDSVHRPWLVRRSSRHHAKKNPSQKVLPSTSLLLSSNMFQTLHDQNTSMKIQGCLCRVRELTIIYRKFNVNPRPQFITVFDDVG